MGQTNVKNLGNGGTMDGDVTITGDLTVSGGISLTLNEVLQGTSTIDVNNTEALLVRKDSDGGDVFIVDTTNTRVGVGVTPTTPMHIKVDNSTTDTTNGLLIEQDGAGDAVAQFLLTGTKRYMMGIDNSDSDNFVIMTGASDLSSGNRLTFDSDMSATFPNKIGIGNTAEVDFHIKLADTANARIEDTSADGIAKLDFKNDQRQATIGVYGDDSDNFKIDHGGGAVLTINTAQNIGIGTTSPQKKVDIVQVYSTGGSSNEDLQLLIRGGNADLDPTGDSIGLGFGYGSANNYVKSGIVHEFTSANGSGTLHFCTSSVSGADTINKGDSRMSINSAGNVTMSGTLTVNGDLAKVSGSHPALQLEDSDDSNFGEIGYSDGVLSFTTNGGDEAGASDTMVFYNHGSTQRMKLLSNGSLQIGTAGNATDVPLMVNNKILIHQDSGGAGDSELTFDRRHDGAVARIQAKAGASGAMGTELHFVTKLAGGSEGTALVLDDNQKAGIGIATPDTLLHIFKADASQTAHSDSLFTIENSGGTYMTILSGATSHGQIHFGDSGQNDDGVVGYDQATNKFYVLTNHSTTKKFQVDANGSSTFQATADTTVATFKGFEGNNGTIEIHADEGDDNADQWRISANTSGELGIGTYSSGSWVNAIQFNSDAHIKTPLKLSEDSGATSIELIPASGQASEVKFFQDDGSTQDARIFAPEGAQDLAFEAGTTEMMRITTTAVGIGVTPEADWLSTRTALQIGGSGAIFGATSAGAGGTLNVGQNVYFHSGGSYRRIDEDEVTMFTQRDGTHIFRVAGSSTDNSTISFTDVAKFDINSRISLSSNDSGGTGGADSTSANTVFGYLAGTIDSGSVRNTFIGHKAGFGTLSDATDNTCIGHGTGIELSSGDNNVLIGSYSGYNINSGSDNVSIGKSAGNAFNSNKIVAVGTSALASINDANCDGAVAIGHNALTSMTTAGKMTAVGYHAGMSIVSTASNVGSCTFVGYKAGELCTGRQNTLIGADAGIELATGISNVAIGTGAMKNADGAESNNICIGVEAGRTLDGDSTSGNTIVGQDANASSAGAVNQTVLGQGATGVEDNSVTLGNASVNYVYASSDQQGIFAGAGLQFPATQIAHGNVNTLDDYEEGDHTVSGTDDSGTFTLKSGGDTLTYTKIGRQVTVAGELQINDLSSAGSGGLRFSLPFAVADQTETGDRFVGTVQTRNVDYSADVVSACVKAVVGTQYFYVVELKDNAMESALDAGSFATNDEVTVTLTYFTS